MAAVVLAVSATATPASAAGVSVSPAQGLDPGGQIVVVRGSGFRPGIALFVMECRASSAEDHTCNSVGLQKVTTDASGSFATRLSVVGRFGATDCLQVACGIKTSAVSGHAGDRSQDTSTAISFRAAPAAPPATAPPSTAAPATAPPATAPPTTAPTTTTPTTTAPVASSTTTPADAEGTTSTTAAGSTTTDAPSTTGDESEPVEQAAGAAAPVAADEPDGSGGSGGTGAPVGALAVGTVVAAALVTGGLLLRRRSTPGPVG